MTPALVGMGGVEPPAMVGLQEPLCSYGFLQPYPSYPYAHPSPFIEISLLDHPRGSVIPAGTLNDTTFKDHGTSVWHMVTA